MEPYTAIAVSDAQARKHHPRANYTTDEGRRYAIRLAPYVAPLVRPDTRALDLGCSFGKSAFLLCELGACVTGIDVSLGALRFATSVGRRIGARISFAMGDYARLPFRGEVFDLALFPHNVVECSPDEFTALVDEVERVLVPEGLFALSTADKWADTAGSTPVLRDTSITIPEEGTFPYPTYSWSGDAVKKVVESKFGVVEIGQMPERAGKWIVGRKQ